MLQVSNEINIVFLLRGFHLVGGRGRGLERNTWDKRGKTVYSL